MSEEQVTTEAGIGKQVRKRIEEARGELARCVASKRAVERFRTIIKDVTSVKSQNECRFLRSLSITRSLAPLSLGKCFCLITTGSLTISIAPFGPLTSIKPVPTWSG